MNKDKQLIIWIRDAISACRLDPKSGWERTIRMSEEEGGGDFKITVEKLPTKGS